MCLLPVFLSRQARLSHYGGGKSSSIDIDALLVYPVTLTLPPKAWPHLSHYFVSLLSRWHPVYSALLRSFAWLVGWLVAHLFFLFLLSLSRDKSCRTGLGRQRLTCCYFFLFFCTLQFVIAWFLLHGCINSIFLLFCVLL